MSSQVAAYREGVAAGQTWAARSLWEALNCMVGFYSALTGHGHYDGFFESGTDRAGIEPNDSSLPHILIASQFGPADSHVSFWKRVLGDDAYKKAENGEFLRGFVEGAVSRAANVCDSWVRICTERVNSAIGGLDEANETGDCAKITVARTHLENCRAEATKARMMSTRSRALATEMLAKIDRVLAGQSNPADRSSQPEGL